MSSDSFDQCKQWDLAVLKRQITLLEQFLDSPLYQLLQQDSKETREAYDNHFLAAPVIDIGSFLNREQYLGSRARSIAQEKSLQELLGRLKSLLEDKLKETA